MIRLATDGPLGRVLAHAIWTLPDRIWNVDESAAERLAPEVAEVVRCLMRRPDEARPKAVMSARRLAIESSIEARLPRRDLDCAHLCAAFDLSRASLYRHFTGKHGVARYIRERRLSAAGRELKASVRSRSRPGGRQFVLPAAR